jgi:hypothetical protein
VEAKQAHGLGRSPSSCPKPIPPGFHGRSAQPALAYQAPTQVLASSSQSNLEESLKFFISEVKNTTTVNTQAIAKMEVQMGQMANHLNEREKVKLPSQPIPNPRMQFSGGSLSNPTHGQEHVQAIVTLRSGRKVDNQVVLLEENPTMPQSQDNSNKEERDAEPCKATITTEDPPRFFIPKAPYPDKLQAFKKGGKFEDILEVFKQVQINIPFLDAIQQVPSYAKFLKGMITVKRRTNVPKKVCLTEQVNSILQCKLPSSTRTLDVLLSLAL